MAAGFIDYFRRYCGGSTVLATLILVNIILFFAIWLTISIGHETGLDGNFTISWLCVSSDTALVIRRPWTLITYMVVQYDSIHLLFNVLWLFWFGVFIPVWLSEKSRFFLYIGGGLTGAVFYILINLLSSVPAIASSYLCGASASVLSIMTAVAIWQPRRKVPLLLVGNVELKWVAIGCIALTFLGLNGGSGAAGSAHVGGALFGMIFALTIKRLQAKNMSGGNPARSTSRRKIRLNVNRDGNAVARAAQHLSDEGRLDQLLDKIRISGYSSLTAGERNELNLLSQRLNKN